MSRWNIVVLVMLLAGVGVNAGAQVQRGPDYYVVYTGLQAVSCASGDTYVDSKFVVPYGQSYIGVLASAGGNVYMDEFLSLQGPTNGGGGWQIYSRNDRKMQTASFPLPADTKFSVEATSYSADVEPVFRSRALITRCNDGTLKNIRNYGAKDLIANNNFEYENTVDDLPNEWTPSATAVENGSRVECVNARFGECYLNVDAHETKKQSYKTSWTGRKGAKGHYVELALTQRTITGQSDGKGKIQAKLFFANGAQTTLTIPAPSSPTDQWVTSVQRATLPAALVKVVVTIKHPGGSGKEWNIDGLSVAVFSPSSFTPPSGRGPLPLPAPAAR